MSVHRAAVGSPIELAQLLRLRELREKAAHAAVMAQRAERDAAARAVQLRQQRIEEDRQHVDRHAAYTVRNGVADLPLLADCFSAFRERLDDTLERNEYALIDDEQALEDHEARLHEQHQAWLREQARRDGVQSSLQRSRVAQAQQAECAAERESEEVAPRGCRVATPSKGSHDTPAC